MACFHLLHSGYDTEVILCIQYGSSLIIFLLLLIDIVVCDLYFDSHILFVLVIILLLIIHITCINCINVRESYEYSLTANKSLL